ncbi:MAG: HD domain-containing protein [Phycisphaerales bacterium]|nr:MAG: HD domain-containing protein [Phycisphaerales bacterium]
MFRRSRRLTVTRRRAMLRVSMVQARPGMVLAMAIYHPKRHGTLLLKAGVELDARTIMRLREIRCPELWIRYPKLDFIADIVNPEVFKARAEITAQIAEAFDEITRHSAAVLDYAAYRRAIVGLLDKLTDHPKAALFVSEMVDLDQPALRHASNVCFLCLLMGIRLDFYLVRERHRLDPTKARDVTSLGVAAMLHDVGMLRMDPKTVERWNQSHDESDPGWREHVRVGYELIRGGVDPSAAAAVLHHHQRFDGSGFPRRRTLSGETMALRGSGIHVFARLIAVADLFDRLRHPESATLERADEGEYQPMPVVRTLHAMLHKPYRQWIDPVIFKALLAVAPAYAPGTIVRLSDGSRGVVSAFTPTDPCRPSVMRLPDTDDSLVAGALDDEAEAEVMDLTKTRGLEIAEADGQDVRPYNFYPSHSGEFDLAATGRSMIRGSGNVHAA